MGVNSLLSKTVTRQRRDCDLNMGPSTPESSMLTTRLLSRVVIINGMAIIGAHGSRLHVVAGSN